MIHAFLNVILIYIALCIALAFFMFMMHEWFNNKTEIENTLNSPAVLSKKGYKLYSESYTEAKKFEVIKCIRAYSAEEPFIANANTFHDYFNVAYLYWKPFYDN